jgi:hypothetical protein
MDGFVIRDTHKLIAKLQQRGFSAQQAEGITEAIKEIDASGLISTADLKDAVQTLELAMREQSLSIIKWTAGALLAQGALVVALIELLS